VTASWVIVRQILLTLGVLLALGVLAALSGALFDVEGWKRVVAVTALMLVSLYAPIAVWFIGEDSLDVDGQWIAPLTIVSVCLTFMLPLGMSLTYLNTFGDRVAVVVTEDVYASFEHGPKDLQTVRVSTVTSGEDLGELQYYDDRDLRAGDRLEALVDPAGWYSPDAGEPLDSRLRYLGYGFGGTGFGLLALLTVLRTVRDLRRVRLTGSRAPISAPWSPPPSPSPQREREELPDLELPDPDGRPEPAGHHGGGDSGDSGD
jgi:hypothetical protein